MYMIDFSFEEINFNKYLKENNVSKNNDSLYDKTTNEIYRIKRLFKIDPLFDIEIQENFIFKFYDAWNPYNGIRIGKDNIGPLCFDAIKLYDYYYLNRFQGLWISPQDGFQGYYGDNVGSGKKIYIKSRGSNPEKYLFRLPIIDCYLSPNHNLSVITMGPELLENDILQIDNIILNHHPKKTHNKFTSLTILKYYYDKAIESSPDPNCDEIIDLKKKYPKLSNNEINQKYNRYYVDKLVGLIY